MSMDYYDSDKYYDSLTDEENYEHMELEYKVGEGRSRFSLEDALDFDRKFVNELLNKESLSKVEKHWIASMHNRVCEEYLDSCRTSKSFDEFVQERIGQKKYQQLIGEWLRRQNNELFQRVGMEEEMKPSAIYYMGIDDSEMGD